MVRQTTFGSRPVSILLVEDDEGDVKAIRRAFNKANVSNRLVRVKDGVSALEFLKSACSGAGGTADEAFILIVDINMPRMDGHALVRSIRENPDLRRLIIFMLTTSSAPEDIERAYDANVAGYIVKEKAGTDFLNLLSMLENYWKIVEIPELGTS